jgi:hypothetical protein
MIPDYWIECLYSEVIGYDWTAPFHKINQKGKACCHWFEGRKVRGGTTYIHTYSFPQFRIATLLKEMEYVRV